MAATRGSSLLRARAGQALLIALALAGEQSGAYEHEHSRVAFQEYDEAVIEENTDAGRPFFLLFSAEWCHWCHEFAEGSLSQAEVYDYLNEHYVSVFIDADIHNAAYVKYRATGLPYAVFLNPDGTVHFKYSGTLYADDFLAVLREIKANVARGIAIPGQETEPIVYEAPRTLDGEAARALGTLFRDGLLESFDPVHQGLGRGEKAVLPRTFLYLLQEENAVPAVARTLERAVSTIFDPVEGGFYRYAETRDWRVPHYEKMADLNAGAVLALRRATRSEHSSVLSEAAGRTAEYLNATLFDPEVGAYLSFQEADTYYFMLERGARQQHTAPAVADKIFVDRLAASLDFLLELLEETPSPQIESNVKRSVALLAQMVRTEPVLRRYYRMDRQRWEGEGELRAYALVARALQSASAHFAEPGYATLSKSVLAAAEGQFFDEERGIFVDPAFKGDESIENLMEINGLIALTMLELGLDRSRDEGPTVDGLITYFSGIGELLEERLWESTNWELMELYVPYLRALDRYLATRGVSQS